MRVKYHPMSRREMLVYRRPLAVLTTKYNMYTRRLLPADPG